MNEICFLRSLVNAKLEARSGTNNACLDANVRLQLRICLRSSCTEKKKDLNEACTVGEDCYNSADGAILLTCVDAKCCEYMILCINYNK